MSLIFVSAFPIIWYCCHPYFSFIITDSITEVYSNKENNSWDKATFLAIAIIASILGLAQLPEGLLQLQKYYFLFLSYRSFSQFSTERRNRNQ